jgi:beta-galactosidase/beta-glucuronidase
VIVPFSPEAAASGIGKQAFFRSVWYRRTLECPPLDTDQRWLLHFGAVDYSATVWADGRIVGRHDGGYAPFEIDLTERLGRERHRVAIVVRAEDDPHDLGKPRGKQDWQLQPHSICYPRTSGIWQSVWAEVVPATRIGSIRWTPSLERWEIGFEA